MAITDELFCTYSAAVGLVELDEKGEVKAVVAEATPEPETTTKVGIDIASCAFPDHLQINCSFADCRPCQDLSCSGDGL